MKIKEDDIHHPPLRMPCPSRVRVRSSFHTSPPTLYPLFPLKLPLKKPPSPFPAFSTVNIKNHLHYHQQNHNHQQQQNQSVNLYQQIPSLNHQACSSTLFIWLPAGSYLFHQAFRDPQGHICPVTTERVGGCYWEACYCVQGFSAKGLEIRPGHCPYLEGSFIFLLVGEYPPIYIF